MLFKEVQLTAEYLYLNIVLTCFLPQVQRIPFEDHGPPLLSEMIIFCEEAQKWLLKVELSPTLEIRNSEPIPPNSEPENPNQDIKNQTPDPESHTPKDTARVRTTFPQKQK